MTQLAGATVLVTGASAGIGEAIARAAAAAGASVALVARSEDQLAKVAGDIEASRGVASPFAADISDSASVARLADAVKASLGTPDVIVNNAGAGRFLFIEETSPEELRQMMAVPFLGAFDVTRAFIEEMLGRGSGHVVNINTPVAYTPWAGALGYACARWAMRGFTEALRADLHGTGIRVTQVVPGKVSSEYFQRNPGAEQRIPSISRTMRTLTPEQVAAGVVRAIERDRRELFIPFEVRLAAVQARLAPRLTRWLVHRTGASR